MGGTESGSIDGVRGKKKQHPDEERRQGRIFQLGMSCLATPPSSPPLSCLSLPSSRYLFHPQKSTATVAQVPKESLSLLKYPLSPFCLSPLSLLLSDFHYLSPVFSSAASSKCLRIIQLWNSTLHLYLCLLATIYILWFKVLVSCRQTFLILLN